MKKIIDIFLLLFCICIASCEDDSKDNAGPKLSITGREADITAAGGNVVINLSVEGEEVESDQPWCTAAISGKVVTLTLEANTSIEGRTAIITVKGGEDEIVFPVTQPSNKVPVPEVKELLLDADATTRTVAVDHFAPFQVRIDDDVTWLDAEVVGSSVVFTTRNNYTDNALSTTVKLVSGKLESSILVVQNGIVLVPEKRSLLMYNAGDEVTVKVNSTRAFTAESDEEWLTVSFDDESVTLKAGDNTGNPERTATVTLVSENLTATIDVVQRGPVYTDYLGNWTLVGMDGDTSFEYALSIVRDTDNSTYKVTGWGKSVVATDSKYAIQANFDEASGLIYITAQPNIAVYTNTDNINYDVMFYGLVVESGREAYVTGKGYICYIGMLQRDGSVQWMNGTVTLQGGAEYEVIGARYYIKSQVDGSMLGFNVDSPFMRKPVMTKVETGMTRGSVMRLNDSSVTRVGTSDLFCK
ncbi:BACON domain-containing protein [uncultured Bacteroides sp.]|uniref:BACON domain-containing protein n=1 Tax=uncultured Bacteroides sp. TaxID=162156 RepID=UPI002675E96D|nr:BACON domain-containing protein [uncultured Bacteroides sp.]